MRYAPAARNFLAAGAVLSTIRAAGVIAFTFGLAFAVSSLIGWSVPTDLEVAGIGLGMMVAAQWGIDAMAIWSGNRVTSELRSRALASFRSISTTHSAETANLLTTGVDAVSTYVVSFLPSVVAAMVFTPIVVVAIALIDPLSGLAVAITIPLIPLFMVLIGRTTQATQMAQWTALSRLSAGFSEIVGGLSTLMLFGRERRQGPRIGAVTEGYRESTMKVLRLSFLSSFALEVGASLSVAVVAVSIGLRLVNGDLSLGTGLWVLLLVPEAFTAIRLVGARFHASADGLTVAAEVFALIEQTQPAVTSAGGREELRFENVGAPGRLATVTGVARHRQVTVLSGPSGAGKSTLLDIIRGEIDSAGVVTLDGSAVSTADCSVAAQDPVLIGRQVEDAIVLGPTEKIDESSLADAIRFAHVDVPRNRPTTELSGGQVQRVVVARAIYRALSLNTPVVLLDEPTSALDADAEREVIAGLRELTHRGHIVIVASHRPAVLASADVVVEVGR